VRGKDVVGEVEDRLNHLVVHEVECPLKAFPPSRLDPSHPFRSCDQSESSGGKDEGDSRHDFFV